MNALLSRQIQKYLGSIDAIPKDLLSLFDSIDEAYDGFEKDRNLIERSLDISSQELMEVNQKLRKEVEVRKQVEQSVLEREKFLSDILESIQDGICVLSPDLEIIRVNKAMEKYFEQSKPLKGKKCYRAYHNRDQSCEICPTIRALETSKIEFKEAHHTKPNGEPLELEIYSFPMLDESGKPTSVVEYVRDVSQRKIAEHKQEELLEQVIKSNEELTRFAYVMTHDLKSPLRGISTLASWIKDDHSTELSEEAHHKLDQIDSRTQRMHALIDGLLAYTRLISSPGKIKAINLNNVVQDVINSFDIPDNIKICIKRELPVIKCEHNRMYQIFHHILNNSIRFMDKSSGEIDINFVERPQYWEFSISDNGPGIDSKYYDKIFKIFQTLERWEISGSAGIGLPLVKKAVELHGGKIWIESNMEHGSIFIFTIPKNINTNLFNAITSKDNESLDSNIS